MISAIVYSIHLIFALVIFTKKWQDENISSAFLNIGLIAILFSVGWTITGMISHAIMGPKGFGFYFDRNAFSLTILTIAEFFFYRMYYGDLITGDDKEIQ